MPKPLTALRQAARPLDERILAFLGGDRENGYTAEEILANVHGDGTESSANLFEMILILKPRGERERILGPCKRTLQELVNTGKLREFKDGEETYYASVQT